MVNVFGFARFFQSVAAALVFIPTVRIKCVCVCVCAKEAQNFDPSKNG